MRGFEELKLKLSRMLQNREGIPQEVIDAVEKVFNQIEEIYENNRCNNSSISEAIYTEMRTVKASLKGEIANRRSEQLYEEVIGTVNEIGKRVEEIEQSKSQLPEEEVKEMEDKNNGRGYEQLSQVGGNNREVVARIMDLVMGTLRDINSRQNRILANIGQLSDDRIDDIQQQVLEVIRRFQGKDEEILMLLENDDKALRGAILEQYESVIEAPKKSKEEEFRDSLDAGISYNEQNENAKAFRENAVDEKPSQSKEELYAQFR